MAQTQDPTTGQKRGPGRPPKAAQPALKKSRLSISTPAHTPITSSLHSPNDQSPTPEKRSNKLPPTLSSNRPLPTLAQPQATTLSPYEYQSIATSAVLQSSLDRSRLKWIHDGIFSRYWTKPESGKNARPPPPNNPDLKWQKHKGPCRIRIEPHIFEADIYVEEKPKPQAQQVKQYVPPASAYGQPYRPFAGQPQSQYYQGRTLPPIQQPMNPLPPMQNHIPSRQSPQAQPQTPQPEKKGPDPVISMLATRASSDPELKSLMKEVATGNATQDQLKVFQGHIDELTKMIGEKKKKDEEAEEAAAKAKSQQSDMIQYDGPTDTIQTSTPQQRPPYQPPYQQQPVYQQPAWSPAPPPPPAAPTSQPVVIQFTTPGATEDRFLFPQYSILESLSPQHLLASCLISRHGRDAVDKTAPDGTLLDPNAEYYQPITFMVEVAYNREHILECVKRWVNPAEEVRKSMEEVMERCTRAPEAHLALRLPLKGSAMAAEPEELSTKESTPVQDKERKTVKYVKKATSAKKDEKDASGKKVETEGGKANANESAAQPAASSEKKDGVLDAAAVEGTDGSADVPAKTETGRPMRAVRKSVRISEG